MKLHQLLTFDKNRTMCRMVKRTFQETDTVLRTEYVRCKLEGQAGLWVRDPGGGPKGRVT